MPESFCFRTLFQSQSDRRSQTLLKAGRQDFYRNFPLMEDKLS